MIPDLREVERMRFGRSPDFPTHMRALIVFVLAFSCAACSGPDQELVKQTDAKDAAQTQDAAPLVRPSAGPQLVVQYSIMAEVLHMAEGVSIWRQNLPRHMYRAFDDNFGLDDKDRRLLKRFAFVRNELWEKEIKAQTKISFSKPFGPQGLFPVQEPGPQAALWLAALSVSEPSALRRGLQGIVQASAAEAVADLLAALAPRTGELVAQFGGFSKSAKELQALLSANRVPQLLDGLGKFCGLDSSKLTFKIYPVWVPDKQKPAAVAYGDSVVIEMHQGKKVGPEQVALVVGAIFERLLARVKPDTKVLVSNRFVESAGYRTKPIGLISSLMDAAGFGLASALVAKGPAQVPPWPGSDARKSAAEAVTGLLRTWMSQGKKLDGVFALKAAKLYSKAIPARPSDFVDGAMVISRQGVLDPFKKKVTRWAVWKFPLEKKYNYLRKLDYSPGRSVLMVLTPRDVKGLQDQLKGKEKIAKGLQKTYEILKKHDGAIVTIPRTSRGYVFIAAAKSPQAMESVAQKFFSIEAIPGASIEVDSKEK